MIAKVPKKGSTSFGRLADYLGQEHKLEWLETRNTAPGDLTLAAKQMKVTAATSKAQKPMYHISLSWDPNDQPTRQQMVSVGDRLLKHLNLEDHQAVMIGHKDSSHPHMHLMINRVHPETGLAWEKYLYNGTGRNRTVANTDYERIESFLRAIEKEYGWRTVHGKHAGKSPEKPHDRYTPQTWEIKRAEALEHQAAGMGFDPETIDPRSPKQKAAQIKDQLFNATSFAEFDGQLAGEGLWLEPKGQGAVATDGYLSVKLSSISREFSTKKLERKFDQKLTDYINIRNAGIDLQQGERMVAKSLDLKFEIELKNAHFITRRQVRRLDRELMALETIPEVDNLKTEIHTSFDKGFVHGRPAYAAFLKRANRVGLERAYEEMCTTPETFGPITDTSAIYTITDHLRSFREINSRANYYLNDLLKSDRKGRLQQKRKHAGNAYVDIARQKSSQVFNKALSETEAGRDLLTIKRHSEMGIRAVRKVIAYHKAFQKALGSGSSQVGRNLLKTIGGPKTAIAMKVLETSSKVMLQWQQSIKLSSRNTKTVKKKKHKTEGQRFETEFDKRFYSRQLKLRHFLISPPFTTA